MKNSKLFKLISFVLIFLLTGVSVFLGTQSFAKYIDEYNEIHGAGIAKPIVTVTNGRLSRISDSGERFVYDNSSFKDGTMEFYDLKPSDVVECFFSINNFDGANRNEVKMKVTLSIKIFLRRLTKTGEIDEYYVVGNTFLVSDNGADQVDMDGSNFSFYYSSIDSLTNNEGDYISIPLDKETDKIKDIDDFTDEYYDGKTLKYSGGKVNSDDGEENAEDGEENTEDGEENTEDNVFIPYNHYLGFIFNPDDNDLQKAFLAKITLPAQSTSGKEYVSTRLFISVAVKCEQIQ